MCYPFLFGDKMYTSVVVGSIPEKITYTFAEEKDIIIGCLWDHNYYNLSDKPKTVTEKALITFASDASDLKMLKKAKEVAEFAYHNQPKKTAQSITVDNTPITNVRLLSLDLYSNKNIKNYKAIIDKYCIEIGDDVVTDTLLKVGIGAGGILQGEYLWTKIGTKMKLVRIGSELHRMIVEFDSKKGIRSVRKNNLEIGGIYQTRKKAKAIFLGLVNTTEYSCAGDIYSANYKPSFEYNKTEESKMMLFFNYNDKLDLEKNLLEMTKPSDIYLYDYKYNITNSHKYIEKIGQVDLKENMIDVLRELTLADIKNKILEYSGHKTPKYGKPSAYELEKTVSRLSRFAHMYPFGSEPIALFDIKKYLTFI
jgi:hypothetical protein